jgi:signal transduction histidine kinase
MLGLSRVNDKDVVRMDLNTTIEDMLKVLGDKFIQDATVQFHPAPALPEVLGVRELTQQMLFNLVLNAADAMSGVGEVTIRTGLTTELPGSMALSPLESEAYAYIAVQDVGCGIAPDILPRIFEPFFTTKSFSSRRGTGLGLSMVYELAKQLGYGLKVNSSVGKGSTFFVYLPIREVKSVDG